MVSAGVCYGGKERLHFIPYKTKVNAKLYIETLLPEHVQDRRSVLPSGFIFQQDGTPAVCRRAVLSNPVLSWLKTGLLPIAVNSLVRMNGLQTRLTSSLWTTMFGELCLNATSHFNPSRRTSMSSRKFCSWYGTSCHRTRSTKPYWASRKYFGLMWKLVMEIQFEHAKMNYLSDFGIFNNSQCFSTMKITSCCWLFRAELKIWHTIFIQP